MLGREGDNVQVRLAQQCGLLEFLSTKDPFVANYLDNLYVRRLTGLYATADDLDVLSLRPTESLEVAMASLSFVDVVGITEKMKASLVWISQTLDLPVEELPIMNDAVGNMRDRPGDFRLLEHEPVTPAIAAELDRLTRLDRVIYEAGLSRLALATTSNSVSAAAK
jgi:hypothetical protein